MEKTCDSDKIGKKSLKTRDYILNITFMGLMTALICVLAPLSIPLPGQIPLSLTLVVIYIAVYLLGGVKGTACVVLYLIIGLIGLPVFSGFSGGVGKLAGPTGGYLAGFIFTAAVCGAFLKIGKGRILVYIAGMILGCAAAYIFGTVWFMFSMGTDLKYTISVCVIPFLPFDAVKIAAVAIAGPPVKKLLLRMDGMQSIIKGRQKNK